MKAGEARGYYQDQQARFMEVLVVFRGKDRIGVVLGCSGGEPLLRKGPDIFDKSLLVRRQVLGREDRYLTVGLPTSILD